MMVLAPWITILITVLGPIIGALIQRFFPVIPPGPTPVPPKTEDRMSEINHSFDEAMTNASGLRHLVNRMALRYARRVALRRTDSLFEATSVSQVAPLDSDEAEEGTVLGLL